jgi:hypothetical protein
MREKLWELGFIIRLEDVNKQQQNLGILSKKGPGMPQETAGTVSCLYMILSSSKCNCIKVYFILFAREFAM